MRLFVALDLPWDVRRALARVIAQLQPTCREARWVRSEAMHVTLKFIGHVIRDQDTRRFADLRAALAAIHSDRPVHMHYRGIGFFPHARRPRVIWCGVESSPHLAKMAADIEAALEPLGIPREKRGFVPHLTLARIEPPRANAALVRAAEAMQSEDFGSSSETEFFLYESKIQPAGADYRKLDAYRFLEGAA